MPQYYSLEEAARVLGLSPDELKAKANQREVRAFQDGGTMQFRVADIDELARRRGLGSDPDLSLSDLDLDVHPDTGTGSNEFDLSQFQLGVANPDLGAHTQDLPSADSGSDAEMVIDEMSLPPGSFSGSSSVIIGMERSGKKNPGDSDVRIVPEQTKRGTSDSDVRLAPADTPRLPSDSDITLVSDEAVDALPDDLAATQFRRSPIPGSSAEIQAAPIPSSAGDDESDSDFELTPSSGGLGGLQPESGSDFELTALDASDEFESTPLAAGPGDSDVTAAEPSASGINLGRPSDSGINLIGAGFDLGQADSIELAPLDDDDDAPKRPAPKAPAAKAKPAKAKAPEKDIFEDTDFEVDALGSDEADDRTVQLEAASDFDLEDGDSASEVFAIDEDDVDQNAATAMAPAVLAGDDDEDDGFGAIAEEAASADGGSAWDVESESSAPVARPGSVGTSVLSGSAAGADWGGLWIGLLGVATVFTALTAFVSLDLVRNLYGFQGDTPASGLVKGLAGLLGG